MTIEETFDAIITALDLIAFVNPNLEVLRDKFITCKDDTVAKAGDVIAKKAEGYTSFEAAVYIVPAFADAAHDFVYLITNPLDSVTTKNLARDVFIDLTLGMT